MIDPINNTSQPSLPDISGFGDISPLGCAFATMLDAFSNMTQSMQLAGTAEAKMSAAYSTEGVDLTNAKEDAIQKLRTEENALESQIAKDPAGDFSDRHKLQEVQAEEGQVKTYLDAQVTTAQSFGANASSEFSGALKGMNALFDVAKEGLNTVVGAAMMLGNAIAKQH